MKPTCLADYDTSIQRLVRVTSVVVILAFASPGHAAEKKGAPPPVWPGAESAPVVRESVPVRVVTADEEWTAPLMPFLDLDPGSTQRNILLPPIGPDGVPPGTASAVRWSMPAGLRVMVRDASGALLGMINGSAEPSVQWATLRAQPDRWDVRVSTGREILAADGVFSWIGAAPAIGQEGSAEGVTRPANPRTNGYSIRFETDAPSFVLNAVGDRTRLRVIADGSVATVVDAPGRTTAASAYGIVLGESRRRKIELLVDMAALRSIEVPDSRFGVFFWSAGGPSPRVAVLGDSSSEGGARSYPWVTAARLNYECWSLAWGDAGVALGAVGAFVPENLIAADLSATAADLVIANGRLMDGVSDGDAYASHVGLWLDAIALAARPEAVKVVMTPLTPDSRDRRSRVFEKAAKQRDFFVINTQGWLTASSGGPTLVEPDGIHLTAAGHEYVGTRLAEEIRKLDLEMKLKLAVMKRMQAPPRP